MIGQVTPIGIAVLVALRCCKMKRHTLKPRRKRTLSDLLDFISYVRKLGKDLSLKPTKINSPFCSALLAELISH